MEVGAPNTQICVYIPQGGSQIDLKKSLRTSCILWFLVGTSETDVDQSFRNKVY